MEDGWVECLGRVLVVSQRGRGRAWLAQVARLRGGAGSVRVFADGGYRMAGIERTLLSLDVYSTCVLYDTECTYVCAGRGCAVAALR